MEMNENFVTEQVAENVEQTTEQTPKTYTQEEVDAIVGKRIARKEAKIRKEYDRKYGDLTDVLKAGTGKESVEEMTDTFQKFYASKGIPMPQKPNYSARDIEVLARAEADEIISGGYEDRSDNRGNYFNIFVPDCTCEDLNFLRLNCAVIDDPEQDGQILASLIDASRRGQTYCAFLIGDEAPFYTLTKKIADEYAGAWLHGTNRFLDGKPTIAENGSMVTYEDKRVIAFLITYV